MPQTREVAWPVTVERLVTLEQLPHLAVAQPIGKADRAAIDNAIADMGLEGFRHRAATTLSGGELARAPIARTLAQDTPLVMAGAALSPMAAPATVSCQSSWPSPGSGRGAGPRRWSRRYAQKDAAKRRLIAQWGSAVHRAIARRKAYPHGTRASGTARIRLTLTGAGQLTALGVASSSGDAALDRAALDAVRAARYPAAPKALGAGPHSFTVPLSFQP